jgi:hypothetical protein
MLQITIPAKESWDERKEEFVKTSKEQTLQLEHSLVSISKWEAEWQKPFLTKDEKTYEETLDYIRCMTITQNVPTEVYDNLTPSMINKINNYISDPRTATTFSNIGNSTSREIITSELVYYWMIANNIPMECQKWHINRLLTLIRVCNVKNNPPKKMNKREIASRYASLNAARRKQMNSRG